MSDRIDDLTEPVDTFEPTPNRLSEPVHPPSESLDQRCADVARRLDAVDLALAEQRGCASLACERLEAKMNAGFERTEGRFGRLERKLDQIIALHLRQRQQRHTE